jgi:mRNA interferase MazF
MPLPAGRRPVVLVSRDSAYLVKEKVTVVEVSTRARGIPSEVPLGQRDGLPRACVVNTDNLVTIPKTLLETRIVGLAQAKLHEVDAALRFSLGLE